MALRLLRQRHFIAILPSMHASDEPMVLVPVALPSKTCVLSLGPSVATD